MRKYLIEKRKSEMVPKPGLPKKHSNKGIQTKKKDPIRCKSTKCYNECYKYKITECLEQHDRLQHGKEKLQELKERNYRAIFRKREHRCWKNRGENTCVNLYRVIKTYQETQYVWIKTGIYI